MANQGARHATGAELGQAGGGSPPRAPPNVKPSSFGHRSDPARPAAVALDVAAMLPITLRPMSDRWFRQDSRGLGQKRPQGRRMRHVPSPPGQALGERWMCSRQESGTSET